MVYGDNMKKSLAERLIAYAKKHPDGFTVKIEKGKIRQFKPTENKRYVVSKTNNDTIRKIKLSFRKNDYTGYAGGWLDKKTGKLYIDKNAVVKKKQKALKLARKHDQLAIFDLLKMDEIQVQKKHGEYKKKQQVKKAKLKKRLQKKRKTKPVVKKDGKWYNTLTQKYVSESYAKRINNYFEKHPDATLHQATGHGYYSKKRTIQELAKDVREMLFSEGNQIIRTRDVTGKTVFYSPVFDEVLGDEQVRKLRNLDYWIANNKAKVELFRLTRDRRKVYHIITWYVNQRLVHPSSVDIWLISAWKTFYRIHSELRKISKKYNLGSTQNLYAHVSCYFYSDYDGWQSGKTFGFVIPNQSGFRILKKEFKEITDYYKNKLEIDSYHNIFIERISFYLWNNKSYISKQKYMKAKYRIGVNRIGS